MITVIADKLGVIFKNRKRLEKELNAKISNNGKEIFIDADPETEYITEKVILALDFGFPLSVALTLKEDAVFEIINIKDHTPKKDYIRIRARIIGKNGKTLRAISELTKCNFELKDNNVGIVGEPEFIKNAQDSLISLIKGSKQANVYAYLEKHQVKPVIDLGLKEEKRSKTSQGGYEKF